MSDLTDVDVAIIGAGPKGIALGLRLWNAGLKDIVVLERTTVVGTWDSAYAGTSPTRTGIYFSDTIIPGDASHGSLVQFARSRLHPRDFTRDHLPKEALQEYYALCAADLPLWTGTSVYSAEPMRSHGGFVLHLSSGERVTTRCLVDATGIVGSKSWPWWAAELPPDRCWHSIGHGVLNNSYGLRLLVVGGGHATPDIAVRMAELGSQVTVCVRKARLRQHLLPYAEEFLSLNFQRAYRLRGPEQRHQLLKRMLRLGPWVTPRSYREMVRFIERQGPETGRIEVLLNSVVEWAKWRRDAIEVGLSNGSSREVDGVICATGFRANIPTNSGFKLPTGFWDGRTLGGFPLLDNDYSLLGIPNYFVLGYLAQLGPRGPIDSILYDTQATTHTVATAIIDRLYESMAPSVPTVSEERGRAS